MSLSKAKKITTKKRPVWNQSKANAEAEMAVLGTWPTWTTARPIRSGFWSICGVKQSLVKRGDDATKCNESIVWTCVNMCFICARLQGAPSESDDSDLAKKTVRVTSRKRHMLFRSKNYNHEIDWVSGSETAWQTQRQWMAVISCGYRMKSV